MIKNKILIPDNYSKTFDIGNYTFAFNQSNELCILGISELKLKDFKRESTICSVRTGEELLLDKSTADLLHFYNISFDKTYYTICITNIQNKNEPMPFYIFDNIEDYLEMSLKLSILLNIEEVQFSKLIENTYLNKPKEIEFECTTSNYGYQVLVFNNEHIDVIIRNQSKCRRFRTQYKINIEEFKVPLI